MPDKILYRPDGEPSPTPNEALEGVGVDIAKLNAECKPQKVNLKMT